MREVPLGTDRLTIAAPNLRWADDGVWWFTFPYEHYEPDVLLPGGGHGPDPAWLALAERVCAQIHPFVAEGTAYLKAFVEGGRFGCPGDWFLEWLEFGRDDRPGLCEPFELVFVLESDTYGGWGVLFANSANAGESDRYLPHQFRRFQR